jgi:hypothetical protein
MIYCGVQLFADSCQIVVVSDAFAVIDQRHFTTNQHDQAKPWLESLKTRFDETVQWFFDEQNLSAYKHTVINLKPVLDDHETFTIRHRQYVYLMTMNESLAILMICRFKSYF